MMLDVAPLEARHWRLFLLQAVEMTQIRLSGWLDPEIRRSTVEFCG